MSGQDISYAQIAKLFGIGVATYLLNEVLFGSRSQSKETQQIQATIKTQKFIISENRKKSFFIPKKSKIEKWGSIKDLQEIEDENQLLKELKEMDSLLFSIQRINNLIVDLKLQHHESIPSTLVNQGIKKQKHQPYLSPSSIVKSGQFVVGQCVYRPGLTLDLEKKFLRAGPRAHQFFIPEKVKAEVVCLGNVCPGMNTVVRQLVLFLKNVYKVPQVTGVMYSFKGYYDRQIKNLQPKMVETAHHTGGCFLGLAKTQFDAAKIVDSLQQRSINQVYLIGANKTLKACHGIYQQIKKRKLAIAICVILKGINRDVPIFDSCFGFETATQQSCKILEHAYSTAKSHLNGVSLVKLPGYESGFLACLAVQSVINVNVCLVPEFTYDFYGQNGILSYICKRIKFKGSCTVVYSEGVKNSLRDICVRKDSSLSNTYQIIDEFDTFLKTEIEKTLTKQKLNSHHVTFFNAIEFVRSAPANSIDTKLCCQIAQASVHGLMAGYTNFACGHLANKNGMISVDELMLSESTTKLNANHDAWQRLLAITGQPSFLNPYNKIQQT